MEKFDETSLRALTEVERQKNIDIYKEGREVGCVMDTIIHHNIAGALSTLHNESGEFELPRDSPSYSGNKKTETAAT